jgi:hypothetical protein
MKKLKSGFRQAVISTLIGLILVVAVSFCVNAGWIPAYSTTILSFFNIVASIFAMLKMRGWGIFYVIGWLAGSFIFNSLGLLEPTDIIFNIVVPIVILALRILFWFKKSLQTL